MSTRTPSRSEIESISWLVSPRIWATTAVMMTVFVVLVGLTGAVLFDAPVLAGIEGSVSDPLALLSIFLAARAYGFAYAHLHRDAAVRAGELTVRNESSLMGMVTVAAFSVVGVLAAGVAFPLLVTTTESFTYLAAAITALVVPVSLPLLVYQLGQRTAADRYKRGYRVLPALWHYLWTLPVVLLAWFLVLGVPAIPVSGPLARPFDVSTVLVDAWTLAYVAIWTPTVLAFLYPLRWYAERTLRVISPR